MHIVYSLSLYILSSRSEPEVCFIAAQFCPPPPDPPVLDGVNGTSNWDEVSGDGFRAPVDCVVKYTCGEGRKFHSVLNDTEPYEEEIKTCLWDQTWQPEGVRGRRHVTENTYQLYFELTTC